VPAQVGLWVDNSFHTDHIHQEHLLGEHLHKQDQRIVLVQELQQQLEV
jgi:hypothetical protein